MGVWDGNSYLSFARDSERPQTLRSQADPGCPGRPSPCRVPALLARSGESGPGGRNCGEFHLVGEGHGTHPRSLDGGDFPQVR
ncbi:hypothetical protein GCM10009853_025360 [Glycomyces scopariae]